MLGGQRLFNRFRLDSRSLLQAVDHDVRRADAQRRAARRSRAPSACSARRPLRARHRDLPPRRVPERLRRLYSDEEQARIRAEQGANAARALAHVSDAVVMLDDGSRILSWNDGRARSSSASPPSGARAAGRQRLPGVRRPRRAVRRRRSRPGAHRRRGALARDLAQPFDGGRVITLRDATAEHMLERARATSSPPRRTSCARR